MDPLEMVHQTGHRSAFILWSALDPYFKPPGNSIAPCQIISTEASLPDLARLPGELRFPGFEWADVVWVLPDRSEVMVRCLDELDRTPPSGILQGRLLKMPGRGIYQDPHSCYGELRMEQIGVEAGSSLSWYDAAEGAIFISRYGYKLPEDDVGVLPRFQGEPLSGDEQRVLLLLLLGGVHASRGLEFLNRCGFIAVHWPLLQEMDETEQSKEHHPEGNVWSHTLNALSHQKKRDPCLGLAILLHDCGKSFASEQGGNRFHRHAQIGAAKSRRFLESLDFPSETVEKLQFLVEHHMLPSFLRSAKPGFLRDAMNSPHFPDLLELYRCDIASSFRPLKPYYQACRIYREYRKRKAAFRISIR